MSEAATRASVILADDHQMLIDSLRIHLQSSYDVVAHVNDGKALVEAFERIAPDVVVSDISMPKLDGLQASSRILARDPDAVVVLVTMNDDPALAQEARRIGVKGYVLKTEAASELLHAIAMGLEGRTYFSAAVFDGANKADGGSGGSGGPLPSAAAVLTQRQLDVLRELARNGTMKDVASVLHIAPRTVAFHKYRIMKLLGIETNAELIRFAISIGLLDGREGVSGV